MKGYLNTKQKEECFGCEACVQICPRNAIEMKEDCEGFRYPKIDNDKCVNCGLCNKVCPYENKKSFKKEDKVAYGGCHISQKVREKSTSGGAFSAIIEQWCDDNYVIFGATAEGLKIFHDYITDKKQIDRFRRSKYSQSEINDTYQMAKQFLLEGRNVVFSGTPCQIAGLLSYLQGKEYKNLLTVEVICEGVPSPFFVRKYNDYLQKKYHANIENLEYRYKDKNKWDFEVMQTQLTSGKKLKKDRWFNPFWSIWLEHLMSRPSCYECPFAQKDRVADISLGDLWGVHLYCPELYAKNTGASLIICNSEKGKMALEKAKEKLIGHELDFEQVLKYQSPMRKSIDMNPRRSEFMEDLNLLDYELICKKWVTAPSVKLLFSKYVWGNRQKVFLWNIKQLISKKRGL